MRSTNDEPTSRPSARPRARGREPFYQHRASTKPRSRTAIMASDRDSGRQDEGRLGLKGTGRPCGKGSLARGPREGLSGGLVDGPVGHDDAGRRADDSPRTPTCAVTPPGGRSGGGRCAPGPGRRHIICPGAARESAV